jgi:hypothetical protein
MICPKICDIIYGRPFNQREEILKILGKFPIFLFFDLFADELRPDS